ncbi:MAG: hypothetical protein ACXADS_10085 [Candidatus Thorarchaeota archaeon]|jgi:hypothetical protein
MKNYRDYDWLKWTVPAAGMTAWVLRIMIDPTTLIESSIGLGLVLGALVAYLLIRSPKTVLWDEGQGIMAILRPWTVEVQAACMLTSVPLGIDLSHSANRVLKAMAERFKKESQCEVRFFVSRPLGNSSTIVGMQVVRRSLRWMNGARMIKKLSEKVFDDVTTLESAMRSSYPHTPVQRAGLNAVQMINSGGILSG